jgi:hypothetical protein
MYDYRPSRYKLRENNHSTSYIYLAWNIDSFETNKIHFLEKKNNFMMDGTFTKLLYLDASVTMNAAYIYFPINTLFYNSYTNFVHFSLADAENKKLATVVSHIESQILEQYQTFFNVKKTHSLMLQRQMQKKNFKVYHNNSNININTNNNEFRQHQHQDQHRYILKISGVWETESEIGITFKFQEK